MTERLLLTGAAGFAGHHICEHVLTNTDWTVVALDRLSYSGTLERFRTIAHDFPSRLEVVYHDFRAAYPAPVLKLLDGIDYVIHNGAETHVENSLHDPLTFVEANVVGTLHTLEAARTIGVEHFIYVSTDEVHGPAPEGVDFKEDATIRPSNPYSASKAGAEALAYSYWKAFRLPVTITRTMNLFGERQHPEKFIPMTIRKILAGENVIIHGTSDGRVGSRKWLHARNQADALLFLLTTKSVGETFHIAGEEHTNLEMAQFIATILGKHLKHEIVDYHSQRPGHDLRYSLDDSKLRSLGWSQPVPFFVSLEKMVKWTVEHPLWLEG